MMSSPKTTKQPWQGDAESIIRNVIARQFSVISGRSVEGTTFGINQMLSLIPNAVPSTDRPDITVPVDWA